MDINIRNDIKILSQAISARDYDTATKQLQLINQYNNSNYLVNLAIYYAEMEDYDKSIFIFDFLKKTNINKLVLHYNLGLLYSFKEEYQKSIEEYDQALNINPNDISSLINKSSALIDNHDYLLSLKLIDKIINLDSNLPEAWNNKGVALNNLLRFEESLLAYDEAIRIKPNYFIAWTNKSKPLLELKKYVEALDVCKTALKLSPDYVEAILNMGIVYNKLEKYSDALECYEKALAFKPKYAEAWFNKGNVLSNLNKHSDALECYEKALAFKPKYAEAWFNKGNILSEINYFSEALSSYKTGLSLKPNYPYGWMNMGYVFDQIKKHDEAIKCYKNTLSLNNNAHWVLGQIMHTNMKTCNWDDFESQAQSIILKVSKNQNVIYPFQFLSLSDSPFLQKKVAENYIIANNLSSKFDRTIPKNISNNKKIKIGYFSSDFFNHATAYLTAELFELHSRDIFEIYGFSFGPKYNDNMRNRLEKGFDKFLDVHNYSDEDILKLGRNLGLDIAIDLKGFTYQARTGIFSRRIAPLQINYLGYPGTMGSDFMDYIVADQYLIPNEFQKFYSEKVIYLNCSYQPNDSKRIKPVNKYSKKELNLPEMGFVYCCFNNNYKILPPTFNTWMKILAAVDNSVLWLLEDNNYVKNNLMNMTKKMELILID